MRRLRRSHLFPGVAGALAPLSTCGSWTVVLLLALLPTVAAWADEEQEAEPPEEAPKEAPQEKPASLAPELRQLDDAEAKPLVDALKKADRKKDPAEVTPALDAIVDVQHEDFEKSLLKLLGHESSLLATRVAEMWDGRVRDEKCADRLFKAAWGDKKNDKRYGVKGKILKALGNASMPLDKKQYEDVERDWRWMIGNPNETFADPLADMAYYFEVTKDKRHCRWLAEELDEPIATNPNSPANPPADWWERRHKMWVPMRTAVIAALKAITGQEFDKTEVARKWFEANEKTFGFRW